MKTYRPPTSNDAVLRRDYVAGKIKTALWRATFLKKPLRATLVKKWLASGNKLLADAAALKTSA